MVLGFIEPASLISSPVEPNVQGSVLTILAMGLTPRSQLVYDRQVIRYQFVIPSAWIGIDVSIESLSASALASVVGTRNISFGRHVRCQIRVGCRMGYSTLRSLPKTRTFFFSEAILEGHWGQIGLVIKHGSDKAKVAIMLGGSRSLLGYAILPLPGHEINCSGVVMTT